MPCNGCGICCASELCVVGTMAFPGAQAPCPALKIVAGRTWCGMVVMEQAAIRIHPTMEPLIQRGLGIGVGCSMDDSLPATT